MRGGAGHDSVHDSLQKWARRTPSEKYGSTPDFVVIAQQSSYNPGTGYVRAFSGSNGTALWTIYNDPNFGGGFASVSTAGDVNLDNYPDIIVGDPDYRNQPNGKGSATIISGNDQSVLATFYGDKSERDGFGVSVSDAGDVNNDGYPDVIVGSTDFSTTFEVFGYVRVFSGKFIAIGVGPSILCEVEGPGGNTGFARAVSGAGDLNQDNHADFLVGQTLDPHSGVQGDPGHVRVYSGLDCSLLCTINGGAAGDQFGISVSDAGDVNLDGTPDFIVGAPQAAENSVDPNGYVRVFSGRSIALGTCPPVVIHDIRGYSGGGRFGWSVDGAGDVNGDNVPDLIVGADRDESGGVCAGAAYVFSGQDGTQLHAFFGNPQPGACWNEFGWSVSTVGGDLNDDGVDDVIIGAYGDLTNVTGAGMARVYFGLCGDGIVSPGEACDDGNLLDGDCCSSTCQNEPPGSQTCGQGVCARTVAECENGFPVICIPGNPTEAITEVSCDNQDNDCDGLVDEDISQTCYTGPPGTLNIGICRGGTETCTAGVFGPCIGEVLPQTETCGNSLDDDCDGLVDEECCGNGMCDPTETSCTCPEDCGPETCGNAFCCGADGETSCSCPADCGSSCGDGCCNGGETCASCPADCALGCGDGCCTGGEDTCTCSADCGSSCGDGCCNSAETCDSCPADCGPCCGDGIKDTGEECDGADDAACPGRCLTDCTCDLCGNGTPDPGEECDDGNVVGGDGCSSICETEPQSPGQQKCINELNKGFAKVAKDQGKDILSCIKDASRERLRFDPTIEDCIIADNKQRVRKAKDKTINKAAKRCRPPLPTFGLSDPNTVNSAAMSKEISLIHDVFGSDLDEAIIIRTDDPAVSNASRCQQEIAKQVQKCEDAKLKGFNKCKKDGLKGGKADRLYPGADDPFDGGSDLALCMGFDTTGKIDRDCGEKLDRTLTSHCSGTDQATAFPGDCAGAPDLGACLDRLVECRVCLALNAADNLARDCDEFDDGLDNASCPSGL